MRSPACSFSWPCIAALGPAISAIPLDGLRLFVGGLLLIFGLQWLRKAILRASGNKALHDETEAYQATLAEARRAPTARGTFVADWCAFTLSFKGVMLEGVEVAFIALTFGANQGKIPLAALAAMAAVLLVAVAGCAIRAPLSRVPENSVKFAVGAMLTAFGILLVRRRCRSALARRGHRPAGPDPRDRPVRTRAGCAVQAPCARRRRYRCGLGGLTMRKLRRVRRLLVRLRRR